MEKKKLLLVAISVGVFLTIVIGAAILVFSPKSSGDGAAIGNIVAGNRSPFFGGTPPAPLAPPAPPAPPAAVAVPPVPIAAGTGINVTVTETPAAVPPPAVQSTVPAAVPPTALDAAEPARNPSVVQNIQRPPAATAIQETNFYINGAQPTETYRIEKTEGESTARVTINVPRPAGAAVPNTPSQNRSTDADRAPVENRSAPSPAKPAPKPAPAPAAAPAKPATTPAKPAATPAKPAPAAKPAVQSPRPAQTKTYTDYWVQTGAFKFKANADGVKETLATRGITSIIENRVIDNETVYQVRVGPYTSENEAKYWLKLVQAINGFEKSEVRQSSSVR